jgi:hypothetical protein
VHPGRPAVQCLGEEVGEQQHLDPAGAKQVGERVVFLLRPCDPGQPVEQQRVVVLRRQALKFGTGTVQDHHPQRAYLGVGAQHRIRHV